MSKRDLEVAEKARIQRLKAQEVIEKKFGKRAIELAQKRLCNSCKWKSNCNLIPIESNGKDCSYFEWRFIP